MKWGMRRARLKGTEYKYRSLSTKKWEKRANDTRKSAEYRKQASEYAKRSAEHDRRMQNSAAKMSTGKAILGTLLFGGAGMKSYQSLKASGMTKTGSMVVAAAFSTAGRSYAKSRFIKGNPVKEFDTTKKLDRAFNRLMR